MTAIPSEEIIADNRGGSGQMHGVASGFGRQATGGEEDAGQFQGVGADRCARKGGQASKVRAMLLPPVSYGLALRSFREDAGCSR